MAAILNAIFGTYPDPEPPTTNITTSANQTTVEGNSAVTTERLHTSAVSDDVQVKSVISSETQANTTINNKIDIGNILSQLSTTHSQVDQYSRARTAEINEQARKAIADVLTNTQHSQEELLVDANRRHLIIDNEYKLQLQKAVEALDAVKAKTLADLERDLQAKQQLILVDAKRQIDTINDQANAAKLHALVEAQEQANKDISHLADQVAVLGQQETQNLLQSTTTTIITSQAQATGNAEATIAATAGVVSGDSMQLAVRSPSELVPASTGDNTTVFGTVTGASDLTTTPASTVTATSNTETEIKTTQNNTNF